MIWMEKLRFRKVGLVTWAARRLSRWGDIHSKHWAERVDGCIRFPPKMNAFIGYDHVRRIGYSYANFMFVVEHEDGSTKYVHAKSFGIGIHDRHPSRDTLMAVARWADDLRTRRMARLSARNPGG